jgi:hypothetical protein
MKKLFWVVCLVGSGAMAAETPRHRCATIADPKERLACYDQAFGGSAEQDFGERKAPPTTAQAPEVANISAKVVAMEIRRNGQFTVTLDNGQSWTQTEYESSAIVKTGDEITIRRGSFGSYLLTTTAGIGTRVKRVN